MSEIEQRSGANFQKTDEKGNTLLMLAVGSTKDLNWKIINTTIEYLIDKVDMNKQNNEGSTAMMLAAKNYNVPAWRFLRRKGKKDLKLSIKDKDGKTAVDYTKKFLCDPTFGKPRWNKEEKRWDKACPKEAIEQAEKQESSLLMEMRSRKWKK